MLSVLHVRNIKFILSYDNGLEALIESAKSTSIQNECTKALCKKYSTIWDMKIS